MTKTIPFGKLWAAVAALATLTLTLLFTISAGAAIRSDTGATVTFESGGIALVDVPQLNFGTKTISAQTTAYPAEEISGDLVISDLRGNNAGWKLTASLSQFSYGAPDSGQPTLEGAFITVSGQQVHGDGDNVATPPSAAEQVVLNSDNISVPVLSAQAGTGMGRWSTTWTKENTTLTVLPGTAREGESFAVISWSLEDTP